MYIIYFYYDVQESEIESLTPK